MQGLNEPNFYGMYTSWLLMSERNQFKAGPIIRQYNKHNRLVKVCLRKKCRTERGFQVVRTEYQTC